MLSAAGGSFASAPEVNDERSVQILKGSPKRKQEGVVFGGHSGSTEAHGYGFGDGWTLAVGGLAHWDDRALQALDVSLVIDRGADALTDVVHSLNCSLRCLVDGRMRLQQLKKATEPCVHVVGKRYRHKRVDWPGKARVQPQHLGVRRRPFHKTAC